MRCDIVPVVLLTVVGATCTATTPAPAQYGPQGVVREFCQRDGMGQRVTMPAWLRVAPLVTWTLEPAWDHVAVIASYVVGPPRPIEGSTALSVDVQYSVVGEISAAGFRAEPALVTTTLRVEAPGSGSWRIVGPPLPPHLFADRIDVTEVRNSLTQGTARFVPDSLFIWEMFRNAGWQIPRLPVREVLTSRAFRTVDIPAAGDLVLYLDGEQPYHAGILAAADVVVSSTINAGIVRAPVDAFAGTVQFARLVDLPGITAPDDESALRRLNRRLLRMRLEATPTTAPPQAPVATPGRPRGHGTAR